MTEIHVIATSVISQSVEPPPLNSLSYTRVRSYGTIFKLSAKEKKICPVFSELSQENSIALLDK